MSLKTRLDQLQKEAPPTAAVDGEFYQVLTWEGPSRYYRILDNGEHVECKREDMPPNHFATDSKIVLTWADGSDATPGQGNHNR